MSNHEFFAIDFLTFDMNFNLISPLEVKNSLSDLKFYGGVKLKGSSSLPAIVGDLNTLPGASKFLFKGHEFVADAIG